MAANGILEFQGTERAIFRGSNSNIVIDTANSSFGVGVDTPTSNLHIVGKTSLQGDLNLVQVSNVANVTVNSNVVAEYTGPHDRPLRKYPEVALTADAETVPGYKGYKVTDSESYTITYSPWRAFDKIHTDATGQTAWYTRNTLGTYNPNYNRTPAVNLGTASGGTTTEDGEYLTLEIPNKICLKSYILHGPNQEAEFPQDWTIYGSIDGITWTSIDSQTGQIIGSGISTTSGSAVGISKTYHITNTTYYNYYAIVITKAGATYYCGFQGWELCGHEEGSGSLDTTLKSVYNVPATTGTQLEVYYDGQDFSGTPTSITDRSPNTITATANNITIDTTYKSFEITSSPKSNIIADNVSFVSGDEAHTYALWVRLKNSQQRNLLIDYRPDGGTSTTGNAAGVLIYDYNQRIQFFHQSADVETRYTFTTNVWYHIICSYSGGGNNTVNSKIYINGDEQTNTYVPSGFSTSTLTLPTTGKLTIGDYLYASGYGMGDGNIASVRLYSKALNADQVKELYDYQKDYFLGSKSQLTLYKGHLGVGVTEPSGQLELAGDGRLQEYPPRGMTDFDTYIEGHGVFNVNFANYYSGNTPWGMYTKTPNTPSQSTIWYGPYQNNNGYSGGNVYSGTDFAASTTSGLFLDDVDGNRYYGAWTTIMMPHDILLKNIRIYQGANADDVNAKCAPEDGVILGSNNGIEWYHVHTFTGLTYGGSVGTSSYSASGENVTINTNKSYKHYALIVTRTLHYAFTVIIGELQWFGTPGPTTLDKGSLSLTRSLDVPRVSRYDVDTETPRPEKLVVDFDTTVNSSPTDISGRGNHGTLVGATYSPADKAFSFDGGDYIQGTLTNSSNFTNTVSVWFKMDEQQSTLGSAGTIANRRTIFEYGPNRNTILQYAFVDIRDTYMTIYMGDSFNLPSSAFAPQQGQWHHFVLMYSGSGTIRVFVDNVEYTSSLTSNSTGTLALPTNTQLLIGSESRLNFASKFRGDISNFKVYSVALEPSEVRKLYRLGRTGRSMVISDTAVGIGKVPEAQLDVRGVARLERLLINGTLGHVLLEEAEIYYDPSRAECQDRTEFMNNTVRDIKGNYDGTKTGISEYNQFWGQDANNSGIATNNNIDLRRDWTAMVWMKPAATDNLEIWKILGHGTGTASGGLHFQGADGSRVRAGMFGNDIDVGTATGMSRRREWNCMTFAYYHNNGVAGGCDKMIYQNERLVGHQQGGIGDGFHFSGNTGGSGAQNGHQPYSASPNKLRFGAGYSSGEHGRQYQHIGPCIFIPRFLSPQEVRSLYRFFAMRFTRVGANS